MLAECLRKPFRAELVQQSRRAFDVGEEESQRSVGEVAAHGSANVARTTAFSSLLEAAMAQVLRPNGAHRNLVVVHVTGDAAQRLKLPSVFQRAPNNPERQSRTSRRKSLQIERADGETRTPDPFITSEVLYQLSYVGAVAAKTARLV
jgi:hypothetical protein